MTNPIEYIAAFRCLLTDRVTGQRIEQVPGWLCWLPERTDELIERCDQYIGPCMLVSAFNRGVVDGNEYHAYVASRRWRALRAVVFALSDGKCFACNGDANQVHHLRYWLNGQSLLGRETCWDVEPVCGQCHDGKHTAKQKREEPAYGVMFH